MFEVQKPKQKPIVIIRAATSSELSTYEKHKLANIEENAQENKIEVIKVNDQRLQIDPLNKEVRIDLGTLAFNNKVTPEDVSTEDLFFIKCELDEAELTKEAKA
jgi:hypothetical protein